MSNRPIRDRINRRLRAARWLAALALAGCAGFDAEGEDPVLARWQRRASEVRELEFQQRVRSYRVSREELREVVARELSEQLEPAYVARYRDAYAAMGLLPPELDLLEAQLDLLQEQLVGLYSMARRTFYIVEGLGPGASMIMVHELIHALQHQHFPATLEFLQELRNNDDLELAIAASVEGDASLSALAHDPEGQLVRDLESARRFQRQLLSDLGQSARVAGIPLLLRTAQTFPYAYGTLMAARVYQREGNAGLNRQLREPPLSALRVRFPDEDHPVEFVRLPLERLAETLESRACRIGHSNVAGTVGIAVLLEEYAGHAPDDALLRAWAGDRFVQLECPEGWELAWLTRWTREEAAGDFARRYRALAPGLSSLARLSGAPRVHRSGRTVLVVTPGLEAQARLLLEQSQVRAYRHFRDWLEDGCFPDASCPASSAALRLPARQSPRDRAGSSCRAPVLHASPCR